MKNKKILIIALFLILFCLLGCSKCFASVSYTYNGNKITLPEIPEKEGYTNYLVYYVNDNPNIVQLLWELILPQHVLLLHLILIKLKLERIGRKNLTVVL